MTPAVVDRMRCIYVSGTTKITLQKYQMLMDGLGLEWQPAGGGYVPANALPVGLYQISPSANNYHLLSAYSCRAMVNRKTRIGWTIDGSYCHLYTFSQHKGVVVENFQILSVDESATRPPAPQLSGGMPPAPSGQSCSFFQHIQGLC